MECLVKDRNFTDLRKFAKEKIGEYGRLGTIQRLDPRYVDFPRAKPTLGRNSEGRIILNPYYEIDQRIELIDYLDKYHEISGKPLRYDLATMPLKRLRQVYRYTIVNSSAIVDASLHALCFHCTDFFEEKNKVPPPEGLSEFQLRSNRGFLKRKNLLERLKDLAQEE